MKSARSLFSAATAVLVLCLAVLVWNLCSAAGAAPASMPTELSSGWFSWIVERFKSGESAIAVGAIAMALVRLLNGPLLKQKIPKNLVPWIAVVAGVLSQGGGALLAGSGWVMAAVSGLAAGFLAIGYWEGVGQYTPILKKPVQASNEEGKANVVEPVVDTADPGHNEAAGPTEPTSEEDKAEKAEEVAK